MHDVKQNKKKKLQKYIYKKKNDNTTKQLKKNYI